MAYAIEHSTMWSDVVRVATRPKVSLQVQVSLKERRVLRDGRHDMIVLGVVVHSGRENPQVRHEQPAERRDPSGGEPTARGDRGRKERPLRSQRRRSGTIGKTVRIIRNVSR